MKNVKYCLPLILLQTQAVRAQTKDVAGVAGGVLTHEEQGARGRGC